MHKDGPANDRTIHQRRPAPTEQHVQPRGALRLKPTAGCCHQANQCEVGCDNEQAVRQVLPPRMSCLRGNRQNVLLAPHLNKVVRQCAEGTAVQAIQCPAPWVRSCPICRTHRLPDIIRPAQVSITVVNAAVFPNRLERDFAPSAPNRVWTGDITCPYGPAKAGCI